MPKSGFSRWIRAACRLLPSGAAFAIACLAAVTLFAPEGSQAQVSSSDPTQLLRSILQGPNAINNSGLGALQQQKQSTNPLALLPATSAASQLPPSRLEQIMSARASVKLSACKHPPGRIDYPSTFQALRALSEGCRRG